MNPQMQSQLDPNEEVTLTNKDTKEVRRVKRSELGQYGLPPNYQSQADIYAKSIQSGKTDVNSVPESFRGGALANLNSSGYKPLNQKELDRQQSKEQLKQNAKQVISILDAGKKGKLSGKAYEDAINAVGANFAASKAFSEGGKSLTGTELSILQGSNPTIEQRQANLIQKAMGIVPAQSGKVLDDEATLRRKMLIALNIDDPKAVEKLSSAEAFKTPPPPNNGIREVNAASKNALPEIASNIIPDAKRVLQGLPSIAETAVNVNNPYKMVTDPTYNLRVAGDMGKSVLRTATDPAYNRKHPVEAGLNVASAVGGLSEVAKANAGIPVESGVPAEEAAAAASAGETALPGIGSKMRASARSIEQPASVFGASREARINNTLDKRGFTGPAAEQYKKLEPDIKSLSDDITKELDANPKQVSIDEIRSDLTKNLEDQLLTKQITNKQARTEISGYIRDLYKTSSGKELADTISTQDLFQLKKKINKQYQGVAKKLESHTPLSPREQVVYAARQTVDDIIATKHPKVKEMTLMQSDLYDAAPSLEKARKARGPGMYFFGARMGIPGSVMQSASDLAGRGVQALGGSLPTIQ